MKDSPRVVEALRRAARGLRAEAADLTDTPRREELIKEAQELDWLALKFNGMSPDQINTLLAQ